MLVDMFVLLKQRNLLKSQSKTNLKAFPEAVERARVSMKIYKIPFILKIVKLNEEPNKDKSRTFITLNICDFTNECYFICSQKNSTMTICDTKNILPSLLICE
jgi:hypothetical protein